ncbi:hypothetical protein BDB01DRAFT_784426 [Pilobolus umbonatus]|nr:hypothetical protein BDB01DRAFT_784426 [Pilobolus umbonatus]
MTQSSTHNTFNEAAAAERRQLRSHSTSTTVNTNIARPRQRKRVRGTPDEDSAVNDRKKKTPDVNNTPSTVTPSQTTVETKNTLKTSRRSLITNRAKKETYTLHRVVIEEQTPSNETKNTTDTPSKNSVAIDTSTASKDTNTQKNKKRKRRRINASNVVLMNNIISSSDEVYLDGSKDVSFSQYLNNKESKQNVERVVMGTPSRKEKRMSSTTKRSNLSQMTSAQPVLDLSQHTILPNASYLVHLPKRKQSDTPSSVARSRSNSATSTSIPSSPTSNISFEEDSLPINNISIDTTSMEEQPINDAVQPDKVEESYKADTPVEESYKVDTPVEKHITRDTSMEKSTMKRSIKCVDGDAVPDSDNNVSDGFYNDSSLGIDDYEDGASDTSSLYYDAPSPIYSVIYYDAYDGFNEEHI